MPERDEIQSELDQAANDIRQGFEEERVEAIENFEGSDIALLDFLDSIEGEEQRALLQIPSADLIIEQGLTVENALRLPEKVEVEVAQSLQPWRVLYGRCRVRGAYSFIRTDVREGGRWLHLLKSIACHDIEEVTKLVVDGNDFTGGVGGTVEALTRANRAAWGKGTWKIPPEQGGNPLVDSDAYMFSSVSFGDDGEGANFDLLGQSAALFAGEWTTQHRQNRHAALYYILYYYAPRFPEGIPDIIAEVKGARVFDPRVSPVQTSYDALTRSYNNNGVLCILDFLINDRYGLGIPLSSIDIEQVKDAADYADEITPETFGEKRYTCDGVITLGENNNNKLDRLAKLRELSTCIAGSVCKTGDTWGIYPARYSAPVISLEPSNFIGSLNVELTQSRQNTVNSVKGEYVAADTGNIFWEGEEYPSISNSTYRAEDGELFLAQLNLPYTISGLTAQRIARVYLEKNRQQIRVTASCDMTAFRLQYQDRVSLTLDYYGWVDKVFRVEKIDLIVNNSGGAPTYGVQLELLEDAEGLYDFVLGEETAVDLAPNTNLPSSADIGSPLNLNLSIENLERSEVSNICLTWENSINPFTERTEIRFKKSSDLEFTSGGVVGRESTIAKINDVEERVEYIVEIRHINQRGIFSPWVSGSISVPSVFNDFFRTDTPVVSSNMIPSIDNLGRTQLLMPVDTGETWEDHFLDNSFNTPQDQINAGFPVYLQPSPASGFETFVHDYGSDLGAFLVEVTHDTEAVGSPNFTYLLESRTLTGAWSVVSNSLSGVSFGFRFIRLTITCNSDALSYAIIKNIRIKLLTI